MFSSTASSAATSSGSIGSGCLDFAPDFAAGLPFAVGAALAGVVTLEGVVTLAVAAEGLAAAGLRGSSLAEPFPAPALGAWGFCAPAFAAPPALGVVRCFFAGAALLMSAVFGALASDLSFPAGVFFGSGAAAASVVGLPFAFGVVTAASGRPIRAVGTAFAVAGFAALAALGVAPEGFFDALEGFVPPALPACAPPLGEGAESVLAGRAPGLALAAGVFFWAIDRL